MPTSVGTKSKNDVPALRFRAKIWLEVAGDSVFCNGLRQMLLAVDSTDSIKAAAAHIGRSYRLVWMGSVAASTQSQFATFTQQQA